jgi:rsbT co-antagonist protein RsbR
MPMARRVLGNRSKEFPIFRVLILPIGWAFATGPQPAWLADLTCTRNSMNVKNNSHLAEVLATHKEQLLNGWVDVMIKRMVRSNPGTTNEIRQQASGFMHHLAKATDIGRSTDIHAPEWSEVRGMLEDFSQTRVRQGFSPSETAGFVFALKEPLFALLRTALADDPAVLAEEIQATSALLDELGLFSMEVYLKSREQVILNQQQELLELSTPVVQLWKGVLAVPLIGTLDSARTQIVMENLLQKIVDTGAAIAIIDITGVPTVDTLVAQHLLKTVAAARLMGADCIISGIRPQIAQTIVHLGVNLEDVTTKATLADAFLVALKRTGSVITTSHQTH